MRSYALAGALICSAACGRAPEQTSASKQAASMPTVTVAVAAREDLEREIHLPAEFRPYQEVEVHAKIAGYVRRILVDAGDTVAQGQVLAELEIPEQADDTAFALADRKRAEAEIARARADVERAESAASVARLQFTRIEQVSKSRPQLVAQQEIDDASARDRIAAAQLSTARAAVAAAEQQLAASSAAERRTHTFASYARITAPFGGVITKRYASVGSMIQAGTVSQTQAMPVVRLSQIARLRLVVDVPESAASRLKTGSPVAVRVDSLGRTIEGRVSRYAHRLSAATRTMEAEVDVPNPSGELFPGMFANVTIGMERRAGAIAVPIEALGGRTGAATILVVAPDDRIVERTVRTGLETPDRIEILDGIREGDRVVVSPRTQLRAGIAVSPKTAGGKR